jgi:hypothetical protein
MAAFEGTSPPPFPSHISRTNLTSIIFLFVENKDNTLNEEFQRPRSGQKACAKQRRLNLIAVE